MDSLNPLNSAPSRLEDVHDQLLLAQAFLMKWKGEGGGAGGGGLGFRGLGFRVAEGTSIPLTKTL